MLAVNTLNWHSYNCYGLNIQSEVQIPELNERNPASSREPEVRICLGAVPNTLTGGIRAAPWLEHTSNSCLIHAGDFVRIKVENGQVITVDQHLYVQKADSAGQRDIRMYLLGTGFAALLYQRQLLPLHVSAVRSTAGAIAFTGASGAGKSSITAWMHLRCGLPFITDDVAVIDPNDEYLRLHPGPPRLKLWNDSLVNLGLECKGLVRDISRTEKYHYPDPGNASHMASPLTHLIVLRKTQPGGITELNELRGVSAYRAIMGTIYRTVLCKSFYDQARLHSFGGKIAKKIRIFTLDRPWDWTEMDVTVNKLLARLDLKGEQP